MGAKFAVVGVGLSIAVWSLPAQAYWKAANGQYCEDVCRAIGSFAISSGRYKNGNPFNICRTNAEGEGLRPGYNTKPNWATGCWVGWGGKEMSFPTYDCLCD